jgi:hypothetical protein
MGEFELEAPREVRMKVRLCVLTLYSLEYKCAYAESRERGNLEITQECWFYFLIYRWVVLLDNTTVKA